MASSDFLLDLDFSISYGPLDDRLNGLYLPALARSIRYDRTAGMFSASSLAIAARGVEALIRNRGHMRLLVGTPIPDEELVRLKGPRELQTALRDHFLSLLDSVPAWMKQRLELLGWMAAEKTLEIRVALPQVSEEHPGGVDAGRHDLPGLGIFTDAEGNQVGICGTTGECPDAADRNYEHLMVYKSWDQGGPYLQVIRQQFERLWDGKEPGWRYQALPGDVIDRLMGFSPKQKPVRSRRADASEGKLQLNPEIKEAVAFHFLQDMRHFPATDRDQPHDRARDAETQPQQGGAPLVHAESCRLPLMRLEAGTPEPLVVYYHLHEDQAIPLDSAAQLESVFRHWGSEKGPSAASEIKAREHFSARMMAREDSRVRDSRAIQQQQRSALVQAALRVLSKAALCDIAMSRHATLFDEDLMHAGFNPETIFRQGKKGSPFDELMSWIRPDECTGPARDDPFWKEVEGKTQKQIRDIEQTLRAEGTELTGKWRKMSGGTTVEAALPVVGVRRYFKGVRKEKPRLTLIVAPARKERFTRYLPFYSMESAFDAIIHGKEPVEEGWMEVEIGKKLSPSMFVMRIEDQAVEPLIPEGHFAVFDSDIKGSLEGAVLFVYGRDLYDSKGSSHLTIRRMKIVSRSKTGDYQEIKLEPLHPDYPSFHLRNAGKDAFRIIARIVCGI